MSVGLPSDEVAEDYKNSLEDLTMNSRYEINNLTVIAKENTEHGIAISRVLENHIRNTPPDRKLPALYVLDSIVKNVGTPYTLFLGHNIYQTFMNAYSLVNNQVRKKLDEMLKTWKEPVPGSLDPRPVFPVETTRPIENALIKARTLAVQQQQQQARSQQEMINRSRPTATPTMSWRNTPTPPQINGRYAPPSALGYNSQIVQNGHVQSRPQYPSYQQYPPPTQASTSLPPNYQQQPSYALQPQPVTNLDSLHRGVANLISAARNEFVATPWDPSIQQRLKALLDLQSILTNQQLPLDQIQLIQNQVAQLAASQRPVLPNPAPAPAPISTPISTPQPPAVAPPVLHQQPDLRALLSSNALAELLASAAKAQQPPPTSPIPQIPLQRVQLPQSQPAVNPNFVAAGGDNSLIAKLRAAGMLPPSGPNSSNSVGNSSLTSFDFLRPHSVAQTPPLSSAALVTSTAPKMFKEIQLTAVSLKLPRPHLVSFLYEARPNQCSTCGRRFLATEEGRAKKARHLDWHFRTNQRLADSVRRGQSRSWYVGELEWITSRDGDEDGVSGSPNRLEEAKAQAAIVAAQNDPQNKYIPVPDDPALANTPCPICQEKFETSWSEDAQDFVWKDAIKIGARVYHASCHAEVKKDGGNTPLRTLTPDSVLGKRKAGINEISTLRSKMPKEIKA